MTKTLRLLFPQWQGGNVPIYTFGARLLDWLAPNSESAVMVEVPVEPYTCTKLQVENGVYAGVAVKNQLINAAKIIEEYKPERIIVFGGDCHVSQAPFAYLNERYEGKLGVLWLDSHPDVSTPDVFNQENAMVLGNLLGEGDPEFAKEVRIPLDPKRIMYGGMSEKLLTPQEMEVVKRNGIRITEPQELSENSQKILEWIEENDIRFVAVHFDLDVLDPRFFRGQLLAKPEGLDFETNVGTMTFSQIGKVIKDLSSKAEIVGLSITEHTPWDALNLHEFMAELDIFK